MRGLNASASTRGPLGLILLANLWPAKTTMLHIPVILGYRPRCKPLWSSMLLHPHSHAALCFLAFDSVYHCFSLFFFYISPFNTAVLSETSIPSLMNFLHNQSLYGHSLSSTDLNTWLFPPALSVEPFCDTCCNVGQRLWHIELISVPQILCLPSGFLQRFFSLSVAFVFPDLFLDNFCAF